MGERRYWIGVVAQDHVEAAVAHGFVQLNYGKAAPLARMQPGDGLAVYSPRATFPDGAPLRAFTAIGRVGDGPIFEVATDEPAVICRRSAAWLDATPAPIKPLLDELSFIRNKEHWARRFASACCACRATISSPSQRRWAAIPQSILPEPSRIANDVPRTRCSSRRRARPRGPPGAVPRCAIMPEAFPARAA